MMISSGCSLLGWQVWFGIIQYEMTKRGEKNRRIMIEEDYK